MRSHLFWFWFVCAGSFFGVLVIWFLFFLAPCLSLSIVTWFVVCKISQD